MLTADGFFKSTPVPTVVGRTLSLLVRRHDDITFYESVTLIFKIHVTSFVTTNMKAGKEIH